MPASASCAVRTANAYAAAFYPTYIRASGVGWALGVGRAGAVIGPGIGGIMLAEHLSRQSLYYLSAIPELVAFAALLVLLRLSHAKAADRPQSKAALPFAH